MLTTSSSHFKHFLECEYRRMIRDGFAELTEDQQNTFYCLFGRYDLPENRLCPNINTIAQNIPPNVIGRSLDLIQSTVFKNRGYDI